MQQLRSIIFITLLACFFTMNSNNQNTLKNYEAAWKKVEEFTNNGLPKSALEEVKKIYELAKKEKQDAQVIKALVYITSLQTGNREDNAALSIAEIEKEITISKEPVASILKSYLANRYWNYYQNNRWKIYDRTKTVNFSKTDIDTWNAEDFHATISSLYLASIKEEKLLPQTKLSYFESIIIKGNKRHTGPTL